MKLMIRLITGETFEKNIMDTSFTVGRSQKCQVVIPHEGVSRQHIQIDVIEGEVYVTDLDSTNGVMIDGQKIEPNQKTLLQLFLNLSFGAVESMMIEFETSEASKVRSTGGNLANKYRDPQNNSRLETKNINLEEVHKNPATNSPRAPNAQMRRSSRTKSKLSEKDKKENFARTFINIVVIGFLIYVGYYVMNKEQEVKVTPKPKEVKPTNDDYF